jgi:alkyl hydroperoxide reductase subunit AhpF
MSTRIPSSLVWLIDKRARLDAEIQKTEQSLLKVRELIKELSILKKDLLAIDKALELHEISVDVDLIKPKKSHYKRIDLPHGEITSSILACLRMGGGQSVSKEEIIEFIVARHPNLMTTIGLHPYLSRSVYNSLKSLYRKGVIQRHHPQKTNSEGFWSLPLDGKDE